jgi:hypothetical protein
LISRLRGEHDKNNRQIVEEVGLTAVGSTPAIRAVNTQSVVSKQLQKIRKQKGGATGVGAGHDYSEHQIKESTLQPGTPEYERRITKVKAELGRRGVSVTPTPTVPETAPSRPRRTASTASSTQADVDKIKKLRAKLAARGHGLPGTGVEHLTPPVVVAPTPAPEPIPVIPTPTPHPVSTSTAGSEAAKAELQSLRLPEVDQTGDVEVERDGTITRDFRAYQYFTQRAGVEDDDQPDFTGEADAIRAIKGRLSAETLAAYNVEIQEQEKSWMTVALTPNETQRTFLAAAAEGQTAAAVPTPAPAAAAARAASTAASAALADPEVEATEAPIRRMSEAQERGGNPYLDRAQEIFERVKGDLKPERKQHTEYMMQAIGRVGAHPSEALLKSAYMEISGKRNYKGAVSDFEKSTFMTMSEVIENKPVDMAVERMKRGYPAMQVARLKPHLKDSFKSAHPDAPPPMPTWGDLKTWREAGGSKPDWAGTTRTSVPKEVFDAAVKSGGKPLYPPAWMPVHLMPLWNYVGKKVGATAYRTPAPGQKISPSGKVDVGAQATYQEGVIIASLRKYVQMRGGPNQLVDIPKSKLSEVGLSPEKIFKAEGAEIAQLKKMMGLKIIDFIELVPFVDAELAQKVKKSYSLVVGVGERPFEKSNKSKERLRKSLIGRIQRLRSEKKFSYMSKM